MSLVCTLAHRPLQGEGKMSDIKQQGILICMPYERAPFRDKCIKAQCAICKGWVAINPATFKSGLPSDLITVCGGCALDVIDSTGGPGEHQFMMTEAQKEGRGSPLVREALREIAKNADWPKRAIELLRQRRAEYSAKGPGDEAGEVN